MTVTAHISIPPIFLSLSASVHSCSPRQEPSFNLPIGTRPIFGTDKKVRKHSCENCTIACFIRCTDSYIDVDECVQYTCTSTYAYHKYSEYMHVSALVRTNSTQLPKYIYRNEVTLKLVLILAHSRATTALSSAAVRAARTCRMNSLSLIDIFADSVLFLSPVRFQLSCLSLP